MSASVLAEPEKVLGCGGFIQSIGKSIEFSKIDVKLFSKQGNLKYQTDCAPNNGYFFIPIYEKGEYTIKVAPPPGWKFTPEEVTVDIDGVNDLCSQNKDINFVFAGFGVVGKVVSRGSEVGPAGVTIDLLSGDGKEVVSSAVTGPDGSYVFTAVPGSDHTVVASHPTWQFDKASGTVSITGDNGQAELLTVSGFDVSGKIMSGSDAVSGVSVVLFGEPSQALAECKDDLKSDALAPEGLTQICHVKTGANGEFVFSIVPNGAYKLVPFYAEHGTRYELTPAVLDVEVSSGSVVSPAFVVSGFSVSGQVLSGAGFSPVEGSSVSLTSSDGSVLSSSTDKTGSYSFESLQQGSYSLAATFPGMEFPTLPVQLSPASPLLPQLIASKYSVSGQLDLSTVAHDSRRMVKFTSDETEEVLVPVEKDGKFSCFVPAAAYSVSVVATKADDQMGIVFAPLSVSVKVIDNAVSNLFFSLIRVTVSGNLVCKSSVCPDLTVTLKPDGFGEEAFVMSKAGKFSFPSLLPGTYSITIDESGLCWKTSTLQVNIESDAIDNIEFIQTGWSMRVASSHPTILQYKQQGGEDENQLNIPVGQSSHCISHDSTYSLTTTSCHQFDADSRASSWTPGSTVILTAVRHAVTGRVTAIQPIPDLQVMIYSQAETQTLAITEPETKDGLFYYRFNYQALPHQDITIEPMASKFLFNPSKLHVAVADDCQSDVAIFTATQGLFLTGSIVPPIADVVLTISSPQLPSPVTVNTDEQGAYSAGPFPRDLEYTVKAEKLGYVIAETETAGVFSAKKLAKVAVMATSSDGEPLPGVLVSLSGGENNYRTNEQTGPQGSLTLMSLSPGEYFVKPVLKEYEFVPKSKLISVKEGADEVVNIVGNRVEFSVFGRLTGLKGDAEPGVILEAIGQGEKCSIYQEEATTANDGKFRIRGLQPGCIYHLGLKSTKSNVHIERTIPARHSIQVDQGDVTAVELIAIRPRTNMDVSLMVQVKKDIKNVKAKMFCSQSPDTPIHTVKLDNIKFVIFPSIPSDGKDCWITVEANAVQPNQKVKSGRVDFVADKPFQHHVVQMELESNIGRGDIGQASWLTLPLIVLVITIILHWEKVNPMMSAGVESLERLLKGGRVGRAGVRATSPLRAASADNNYDDIDKTVKFVEASTKNRIKKIKKI